jgi:molybdopterin-guanine dinucleotide biosynthesis protein MobB
LYNPLNFKFKRVVLKKRLAVAFTGPSNSGKTTLILKVARKLINEHKKEVAIVKHDPGDKARFDVVGKDSYKFSDTGAEVIIDHHLLRDKKFREKINIDFKTVAEFLGEKNLLLEAYRKEIKQGKDINELFK